MLSDIIDAWQLRIQDRKVKLKTIFVQKSAHTHIYSGHRVKRMAFLPRNFFRMRQTFFSHRQNNLEVNFFVQISRSFEADFLFTGRSFHAMPTVHTSTNRHIHANISF